MRKVLKRVLHPPFKRFVNWYYKKPRPYRYQDLRIQVNPGVFPPHFILSTRILLNHLSHQNLENLNFLELGCGTGILSLQAARQGAQVLATDINPSAVSNARENALKSGQEIQVLQSDLFERIPPQAFDLILINPPYYPKDPQTESEYAWFCGSDFQYFHRLFADLKPWLAEGGEVQMILSEDCAIDTILGLAQAEGFETEEVFRKKSWGEMNYIYRIR